MTITQKDMRALLEAMVETFEVIQDGDGFDQHTDEMIALFAQDAIIDFSDDICSDDFSEELLRSDDFLNLIKAFVPVWKLANH